MAISKDDVDGLVAAARKLRDEGSPEDCAAVAEACNHAMDAGAPLSITQPTVDLLAACRARIPQDDRWQADLLGLESVAWHHRYRRTGADEDLRRATVAIDKACTLTGPGHRSHHRLRAQQALIHSLRPGSDAVPIDVLREAVEAGDPNPHNHAVNMLNLAGQLNLRYLATRDFSALDEAIGLAERALALDTRTDDDDYSWRLLWAGQLYVQKGHDTRNPPVLKKGVDLLQKAVTQLPPGHSFLPGLLNQLGGAMHAHSRLSGPGDAARSELTVAVHMMRAALRETDPTVPDYPTFASNLAMALGGLSKETGDLSLLDEAIDAAEKGRRAAAASPTARDAETLTPVVGLLRSMRDQDDPAAIHALSTTFDGSHRLDAVMAGQLGAGLAARAGDWRTAVRLTLRAVEILPHAASEALSVEDREKGLAKMATSLARDACALVLRTGGSADQALHVLETARATLVGQALTRRSDADLDPVRELAPHLAERMRDIRADLARVEDAPYGPAADRRHRLTNALHEVTRQIRAVPGLEDYLRAPGTDMLRRRAGTVPVVTLNVSEYRCDALVLRAGEETGAVALPDLALHDVTENVRRFTTATAELTRWPAPGPAAAKKHQQVVREVLAWLWESVTEPVLRALGITSAPRDGHPPSRLRWSATGPLTLLPLHAAGLPDVPGACVADRVVSSYTPTLRLLGDAASPAAGTSRRAGHLVVPVPHSSLMPHRPLEGAGREAAHVVSTVPGALPLPEEAVSALAVRAGLRGARSVHFACHGQSNAQHPSRSQLVLRDETLTVADLMTERLDGLELAVLSACSTAHAGEQLPDEVLHLTSAFRAAGARHVVGTLWETGDRSAAEFTEAFYATLGALPYDGPPETVDDRVATAVHRAAQQVRAQQPSPRAWAPFVHVG
ncbi:CHAT domain-containing protein [Streptomyces sp. AC550_RSS872]|uniref:CHAT domain-containing protein n=1 Tax=Streptomyces sp. AC550_RSS872 TaxID=2823689 RepID=UPI001C25288F|nr:CHAT domain-containing protein [Streptomyces sp. AC550_RSS872]